MERKTFVDEVFWASLMLLEACHYENAALRSMLEQRGVKKRVLARELKKLLAAERVRRIGALSYVRDRRSLLQLFEYAEIKEMLEKLPSRGKPQ